jgi:hypothetical protein
VFLLEQKLNILLSLAVAVAAGETSAVAVVQEVCLPEPLRRSLVQ